MNPHAIADALKSLLQKADMSQAAKEMDVSIATAYRYRNNPLDMPFSKFLAAAEMVGLPVSLGIMLVRDRFVDAERYRLKLEQDISRIKNGWRHVTTHHFTVNCEVEELTDFLLDRDYPEEDVKAKATYKELRAERCNLYMCGSYKSTELIYSEAYLDFFMRRNRFDGIPDNVWRKQYEAIIDSHDLPSVNRLIYTKATPELPVVLCYSTGVSIVRIDDLTIELHDPEHHEMVNTITRYTSNCRLHDKEMVRRFLLNPLKV